MGSTRLLYTLSQAFANHKNHEYTSKGGQQTKKQIETKHISPKHNFCLLIRAILLGRHSLIMYNLSYYTILEWHHVLSFTRHAEVLEGRQQPSTQRKAELQQRVAMDLPCAWGWVWWTSSAWIPYQSFTWNPGIGDSELGNHHSQLPCNLWGCIYSFFFYWPEGGQGGWLGMIRCEKKNGTKNKHIGRST